MPYTAITPFRTAVQRIVQASPYPRLLSADRRPRQAVQYRIVPDTMMYGP